MARMSLAERRTQLVAAAITVMTRDGVRAATTRAVVAEAGTSLSVFHYCFESKHQLLLAVVTELAARNTRTDDDAPALAGLSPRQAVRAGLEAYWEDVLAHPAVHQLTYEVTQFCLRDPKLEPVAVQQYELYAAGVLAQFEALGVQTTLPAEVVARHVSVTMDGLTLDWLVRRDEASSRAALEAEIAFVESVLVPETA